MPDSGSSSADPSGEVHADRRLGDRDLTVWPTVPGRAAARAATRASRRFGPQRTLIGILGVGVVIAFLLAFGADRVYDAVTESDGIAGLDHPALAIAMQLRSPVTDGFSAAVSYVFGTVGMPIIAVVACIGLALHRRSWTPITLTVGAGVGSLLMTIAGKDVIDRHRPPLIDAIPPYEHSPSFPSGHTLNAVVVLGVLTYLLLLRQRRAGARIALVVASLLVVTTVGLTRVLLSAHWFTDVVAGWLLGGAWLAIVITAHRLYLTARARRLHR